MTVIVDTLRAEVRRLSDLRLEADVVAQTVRLRKAAWEEANAELLAQASVLSRAVADCEGQVRTLAQMATELTGEKKPAPGVEVRTSTKVTVQDAAAALEWARASRIGYVPESIDAKAIEAAAGKAKLDLPFLKTEATFKAFIATDLGKVLLEAEQPGATVQPLDLSIPEAA